MSSKKEMAPKYAMVREPLMEDTYRDIGIKGSTTSIGYVTAWKMMANLGVLIQAE